MSRTTRSSRAVASAIDGLCTHCGICCDGTLFHAVELQSGDQIDLLRQARLGLRAHGDGIRFPQPCGALEGCLCRVYPDRPRHCRQFECGVLEEVVKGTLSERAARGRITRAKRLAQIIRRHLAQLGDGSSRRSLRSRFLSAQGRLESQPTDPKSVKILGSLGESMHQLNLVLSRWFYSEDLG